MQKIKLFRYDNYNSKPLDEQINEYLTDNPDHLAKSITVVNASSYQQAFVIFDIREDKSQANTNNKNFKNKGVNNNG